MKTACAFVLFGILLAQNTRAFIRHTPKFAKSPSMVFQLNAEDNQGYALDKNAPQVPGFANSDKFQGIRALGLWAFYDKANFDPTSAVTPINGDGRYTTDKASAAIMSAKSVRALSDANNVQVDRFEAFPCSSFLGDSTGVLDNSALKDQPAQLFRSLAIYTYTRHVIMCKEKGLPEDDTNCFCLNGLMKDSYLIPDLKNIKIDGTAFGDIRQIRQLDESEEDLCDRLKPLCASPACNDASVAL